MRNSIFRNILRHRELNKKMLAVLLDPDQCKGLLLINIVSKLKTFTPDFVFVGGSHTVSSTDALIEFLKEEVKTEIVQFPGNAAQFSTKADALLFLSLISGRNAEFLIGQHVNSAMAVKNSGLEVIPTAYILIEGGKNSSVEYMSNTRPIPHDKVAIVVSTAVAGELLGMKLAYLEAGSGAQNPVSVEMIQSVSENLSMPLIVGGGIKTTNQLKAAYNAGADIVVVGNAFESEPEKIQLFVEFTKEYNASLGE
ncbi:MAG: geranylgeranylglyceryl/heptaprenylglyceryl phosphate synthase [Paludibacter sp.]|nr:geranylgeranylglyceryl/heptaprenylglyceryl phosphate synthase [Paludibacter sp.]